MFLLTKIGILFESTKPTPLVSFYCT